jgi:hypothetical protein
MLLMAGHRPFICGPKASGALLPRVSRPALGGLILLDEDELPCARPGLRRQRRLAPRPEDLYQHGHRCFRRGLARLQRLRGAPLQPGLELQLKVLLEGRARRG